LEAGLLTHRTLGAFPVPQWLRLLRAALRFTAAGTVPDLHRIPIFTLTPFGGIKAPLTPRRYENIATFAPLLIAPNFMTKHWFTCKVKRVREDGEGNETKVTDLHVLDAYNYTEAETRITFLMQKANTGPFEVQQITKSNFAEVIRFDDTGHWYRAKVAFVSFVDETGEEKSSAQTFLVNGEDIRDVYDKINEFLRHTQTSYVISSISFTKIIEVYPLSEEDSGDRIIRERGLSPAGAFIGNQVDPDTGEVLN